MTALLLYGFGALIGIFVPLGSARWGAIFLVSIVLDDQRIDGVSVTNVAMMAFLACLAAEYLTGRRVRVSRFAVPMLALVLLAIVSTALAAEPVKHAPFVVSLIGLTATSCGLASVAFNSHRLERLASAVLWMSGILAVAVLGESLLWFLFGVQFKENVYVLINLNRNVLQASGFFTSNGLAALHLIPGTVLAGVLRSGMANGSKRRRLNWYLALTTLAMISTLARAALVSLVLFALVLLFRRAARPGWGRLFAILLIVLVVAVVPSFLRFTAGFNIASYVARYSIILGGVDSITNHPVIGSGPGSKVLPRYPSWSSEVAPFLQTDESSGRDTHNTLLQIPVDLGLMGLLWFTTVNVVLFGSGLLLLRRLADRRLSAMLQSLLIALFLTEFFSLFDSALYTKPIWILFGLTSSAIHIARARRSSSISLQRAATPAFRLRIPCDA